MQRLTYQNSHQLLQIVLRVPKEHSHFVYFIIEANDGFCFYSTIDSSLKENFRDIILTLPIEWADSLDRLLARLQETIPLDILSRSNEDDNPTQV